MISCHFAYAGDERIVQAVQAGFDVDDISLDPCQLQNSSNTGQYMIDMFTIFKNIKIKSGPKNLRQMICFTAERLLDSPK